MGYSLAKKFIFFLFDGNTVLTIISINQQCKINGIVTICVFKIC